MKLITLKKFKGQGLIETLIIMFIVLGCVVALVRFQINVTYNDSLTQQQSDASLLAVSTIETLRDFQVLNTQSPYTAYQGIASGTGSATTGNTSYSLSWTVTSFNNPTYKTIDITVSWTDRRNAAKSVRLITDVAGIEPANSSSIM